MFAIGAVASASWRAAHVEEKDLERLAACTEVDKEGGLEAIVGVAMAQREAARPARRAACTGRSSIFYQAYESVAGAVMG